MSGMIARSVDGIQEARDQEYDDRALFQALTSRDSGRIAAALGEICVRYRRQLWWYLTARVGLLAADDLTQEVFVRLAQKAHAGRLADRGASITALLDAFAWRISYEYLRQRSREIPAGCGIDDDGEEAGWVPVDAVAAADLEVVERREENRQFCRAYRAAVRSLDPLSRRVYVLRRIRRWRPVEVARTVGLSRGAIDARYSRAVAAVLVRLGQSWAVRKAIEQRRARGAATVAGRQTAGRRRPPAACLERAAA